MIQRNQHPAGKLWNLAFGLAQLFDGLVRTLSLGYLHTTAPLDVSRRQARAMLKRMKNEL